MNIYEKRRASAIAALNDIDPREPYGAELFNAIARVSVSIGIEAVCLRRDRESQKVKVLLVRRSQDDTAYPGEWHCPGSILRPGEEFSDVFDRLGRREFQGKVEPKRFVDLFNNIREQRGHFLSLIYLCETTGAGGVWFPTDTMPENTVDHHRDSIIPMAISKFESLGRTF